MVRGRHATANQLMGGIKRIRPVRKVRLNDMTKFELGSCVGRQRLRMVYVRKLYRIPRTAADDSVTIPGDSVAGTHFEETYLIH